MLTESAEQYIWDLFRYGLIERSSDRVKELIASLFERYLEFPQKVEVALTDYWAGGEREKLLSLALVVLKNFYLGAQRRTQLVAHLFVNGDIDIAQAYGFLGFEGVSMSNLPQSIQRVADVYWLLRQDADAQFLNPSEGKLLDEALRALARDHSS